MGEVKKTGGVSGLQKEKKPMERRKDNSSFSMFHNSFNTEVRAEMKYMYLLPSALQNPFYYRQLLL
jgi:hypothetical protein